MQCVPEAATVSRWAVRAVDYGAPMNDRLAGLCALLLASVAFAAPTFSVELTVTGPNKISVIKVVREVTGLGLKEAKDLVEAAPKVVKSQLEQAAAEEIAVKLRAAGATAVVASGAAAPAPRTAAAPVEGGLSTVTLTACGPKKIDMIKIVREVTGLGLKESKDLVEKTPSVVKKGMTPADAEALANRLQFAGGTAKVAPDAP